VSAIDTVRAAAEAHGQVRRVGAELVTNCPAHPDEHPSLYIREMDGGKVTVTCRSNHCAFRDIAAGWGLAQRDFFPPKPEQHKRKGLGPCVATFLYELTYGKTAYKACRFQFPGSRDKTFVLFRPDENGRWIANLKGVERIPYRLPELSAADLSETLFILEGERKVDLVRKKLGIVATCNPGGAGGSNLWKTSAFAKGVKGRDTIIIPDNDPAGEKHATTVAQSIAGVAKSIKIVRLPLKNAGDDVVQWIEAGGTREQLLALVEAAPIYGAAEPEEPITQCLEGVKPEAVTWLWTGRLAVGKITVLDGAPGSGKSTMTCDAAARVSRGLTFPHDRHARQAGGVIFVAGEDGVADTVVPRLLAAGADLSKCFVWPASKLPYLPDAAENIVKEIKLRGAKLLVLDPVTALFARDLSSNSDQDVRLALTPLAVAAEELACCVLLLRHLNKRTGASAFDRGGGSVGIGALARVVLLVARDHSDPDLRILATVKANLTRPPRSLQARILDVNGVGRVDYGDECDTTADSLVSEPKPERKGKVDSAADWLRQALGDGQWRRQKQIETEATAEGITPHTLRRARESIGCACRQMDGGWWWRLPDAHPTTTGQVDTWTPGQVTLLGPERINNNSGLGVPDSQASTPTHTPPDGHLTADAHLTDGLEPPKDTL